MIFFVEDPENKDIINQLLDKIGLFFQIYENPKNFIKGQIIMEPSVHV